MRAFAFDGARILAFVTRQRRPWFVHLARRFDRVRGEAIDRRDELRRIPGDAGSGCGIDRICLGDEYVEGGAFVARERFEPEGEAERHEVHARRRALGAKGARECVEGFGETPRRDGARVAERYAFLLDRLGDGPILTRSDNQCAGIDIGYARERRSERAPGIAFASVGRVPREVTDER